MAQPQIFKAVLIFNKGGNIAESGTWAIDEVAIVFASGRSVEFRIWVNP
ncbi:MAG: hypothetical protein ACYTXE_29850 [Nostoc sp.]